MMHEPNLVGDLHGDVRATSIGGCRLNLKNPTQYMTAVIPEDCDVSYADPYRTTAIVQGVRIVDFVEASRISG